ncbi:alpha/beta fold hydrolase [Actinoplanes cyaneus]|uniref:alpha/beta fold hydrolase n=1 Tax=Actinoplanes cyaneus TaxID=52696 RepID=UPI001EF25202|nr:alpha/beta hydrolase [Actinoplanes cyaneus]MCW2144506.1 Pimeloyl-ACP methyl ester carboxylesterase [Actinoplanes cyaneus]
MSDTTVVLVHGAFAESASWSGVIALLQAAGHHVIAAPNALRSLSSDSAALSALIASIDGPVVLAGHSYGGSVITNAARGHDHVRALAYIAAFAPVEGESVGDVQGPDSGSTLGSTLTAVRLADGTNDLYIRPELFHEQFAADLPPAQAGLMAATQRPVRDVVLTEASGTPAWQTLPSWFLLAGADHNIPIDVQRFMAARAGARDIVEVGEASHAVLVTHPDQVAALILDAIAAA